MIGIYAEFATLNYMRFCKYEEQIPGSNNEGKGSKLFNEFVTYITPVIHSVEMNLAQNFL